MNNFNTTACEAQQANCNATIQHTVADVVDGVVPERVTDIEIEEEEEEEEEGGRVSNMHALASTPNSVILKYMITVHDSKLTFTDLTALLQDKVASRQMDARFQTFARHFNMSGLGNCTFAEPKITHLNQAALTDSDSQDDTGLIVGVSVGGAILLLLLLLLCVFLGKRKSSSAVAASN